VVVPSRDSEFNKAIKMTADENKIPWAEIDRVDIDKIKEKLGHYKPQLAITICYPYLIDKKTINNFDKGIINLHTSLLPRGRGNHPINWDLIRGERETGVSVHYIDEGMDSGDIISQRAIPISAGDTVNSLINKAIEIGANLLIDVIEKIETDYPLPRYKQKQSEATFALRRKPEQSYLHWEYSSAEIDRFVRALVEPYPNAWSKKQNGEVVKLINVGRFTSGMVIAKYTNNGYIIGTNDGVVAVQTDQPLELGEILK
jgi:methionyl-tRNA formyltransferase